MGVAGVWRGLEIVVTEGLAVCYVELDNPRYSDSMRRLNSITLSFVITLGMACGDTSPDGGRRSSSRSELGGRAPAGFAWQREETLTECLVATPPSSGLQSNRMWTDSAEVLDLAFQFLGTRVNRRTWVPSRFVPGDDGSLVQVRDTTPGMLDGSATIYITRHGCVTALGW